MTQEQITENLIFENSQLRAQNELLMKRYYECIENGIGYCLSSGQIEALRLGYKIPIHTRTVTSGTFTKEFPPRELVIQAIL